MKDILRQTNQGLYETLRTWYVVLLRFRARFYRFISNIYERMANGRTNLQSTETQNGWSVVIITDGKSNHLLDQAITSMVRELAGTPFEIIVVGPASLKREEFMSTIRHIPYREFNIAPGWITKKKNVGVADTHYDKVVLTHDYLAFEPGWKKGFDEFGSDFDVCMNRIVNADSTRWKDWIMFDFSNMRFTLIPYDVKYTKHQYISGTYFVVKRNFYAQNPLDEKLRWGEAEDAEWSRRVSTTTTFQMNTGSAVKLLRYKPLPEELWTNEEKNEY